MENPEHIQFGKNEYDEDTMLFAKLKLFFNLPENYESFFILNKPQKLLLIRKILFPHDDYYVGVNFFRRNYAAATKDRAPLLGGFQKQPPKPDLRSPPDQPYFLLVPHIIKNELKIQEENEPKFALYYVTHNQPPTDIPIDAVTGLRNALAKINLDDFSDHQKYEIIKLITSYRNDILLQLIALVLAEKSQRTYCELYKNASKNLNDPLNGDSLTLIIDPTIAADKKFSKHIAKFIRDNNIPNIRLHFGPEQQSLRRDHLHASQDNISCFFIIIDLYFELKGKLPGVNIVLNSGLKVDNFNGHAPGTHLAEALRVIEGDYHNPDDYITALRIFYDDSRYHTSKIDMLYEKAHEICLINQGQKNIIYFCAQQEIIHSLKAIFQKENNLKLIPQKTELHLATMEATLSYHGTGDIDYNFVNNSSELAETQHSQPHGLNETIVDVSLGYATEFFLKYRNTAAPNVPATFTNLHPDIRKLIHNIQYFRINLAHLYALLPDHKKFPSGLHKPKLLGLSSSEQHSSDYTNALPFKISPHYDENTKIIIISSDLMSLLKNYETGAQLEALCYLANEIFQNNKARSRASFRFFGKDSLTAAMNIDLLSIQYAFQKILEAFIQDPDVNKEDKSELLQRYKNEELIDYNPYYGFNYIRLEFDKFEGEYPPKNSSTGCTIL